MKLNRRTLMKASAALAMTQTSAHAGDYPRLIIDAIDLHNSLEKPVERVVLASHYSYEDFTAIAGVEGWAKIVGIAREPWADWRASDFAEYAKVIPNLADIADVGAISIDFDAEKVIALKPDLVFVDLDSDSQTGDHIKTIKAANIPVVRIDFQSDSLLNRQRSIVAIGRVMESGKRSDELINLYDTLYSDVLNRTPLEQVGAKSVYIELAEQGPEEIGWTESDRLWGRMAAQMGATNIAYGLVPDYGGQLPAETLFKADPDLIFFAGSSWPSYRNGVRTGYNVDAATTKETLAAYAARPGYEKLKAVKSGNVFALEHNLAWSLRDVYAMQFMCKQLYPEAYADIDPIAGLKSFHERFLPVPFSGTWFASLR